MKLTVNPITNGSGQVEIHSRIQKLQIFFSALIANYATGQALLTALGSSILIEVTRQSKQGTKTMIYSVNVLTLMEIASANEGAVRCFKDATKSYVIGTVELADEGAVQFGKNDFITVKVQAVPNNINLDLFAIDSDHETRTVNHYEQIHINANAPKDIEVHNTRWLAIPRSVLKTLTLEMAHGKQLIYTPEELDQQCSEGNEQSFIIDGLVTPGGKDLYTFNVAWATRARIDVSADTNVFVMNYVNI